VYGTAEADKSAGAPRREQKMGKLSTESLRFAQAHESIRVAGDEASNSAWITFVFANCPV